MRRALKQTFLWLARRLGLFRLAEWLTAGQLRIICFHGLSLDDEHLFRPMLFMRPDTFRARLGILRRRRLPVIPLAKAVKGLRAGTLPRCATVITFDDGFHDNYRHALAPLLESGFPATIYVTTYYVEKQSPVFRLVVAYMFWKSPRSVVDLRGVAGATVDELRLDGSEFMERAMWNIIRHGEDASEEERVRLSEDLARRLGVDYQAIARDRRLSLMTPDEIREMRDAGVDFQLHTHRHRMPDDRTAVLREIDDNRTVLEAILGSPVNHLCYPSGVWSTHHWPWLREAGVESATTCDPGMNPPATEPLGLRRFLDGESVSALEFEAELSGFAPILRRAFGKT